MSSHSSMRLMENVFGTKQVTTLQKGDVIGLHSEGMVFIIRTGMQYLERLLIFSDNDHSTNHFSIFSFLSEHPRIEELFMFKQTVRLIAACIGYGVEKVEREDFIEAHKFTTYKGDAK